MVGKPMTPERAAELRKRFADIRSELFEKALNTSLEPPYYEEEFAEEEPGEGDEATAKERLSQ